MKQIGVVRFLGTNCDFDVYNAINETPGLKAKWLWYEDKFDVKDVSGLVLPGGFSYGDYLRCGALAAKMPVMDSVEEFSKKGGPVLGICNGFQVLCERNLLPGVLLRNENLNFIDKWVELKNESSDSSFWNAGAKFNLPIAHGEGRYFISKDDQQNLEDSEQVWLKYSDNPNGSVSDIAGVFNKSKNIAGLMPHPERAVQNWMGGDDGQKIIERFC